MSAATVLTLLRTAATVVVAVLASLSAVYPHATWLQITLASFATLGIHAVPAIKQGTP